MVVQIVFREPWRFRAATPELSLVALDVRQGTVQLRVHASLGQTGGRALAQIRIRATSFVRAAVQTNRPIGAQCQLLRSLRQVRVGTVPRDVVRSGRWMNPIRMLRSSTKETAYTHSSRSSFGPLNSFALGPLLAIRGMLVPDDILSLRWAADDGPSSSSSDEELLKIEYLTLRRKGRCVLRHQTNR